MTFIALDPGKKIVYGARFVGLECVALVEYDPRDIPHHLRTTYSVAVVEKPSIMNTPNAVDMAEVLWAGASVANALSGFVHAIDPIVWKGSVKKPVHHGRVWECMTPKERALFPANTHSVMVEAKKQCALSGKVVKYNHKWHNHLDALALGMFYLLRIKRGGEPGVTHV